MIYLGWYLVIGILIVAAQLIYRKLAGEDESRAWMRAADGLDSNRWQDRLFKNLVAPALIAVIWPIAVIMVVHDFFSREKMPEEVVFAVTHADLLHQLTISDIEKRERVIDPMEAVPELPFGHLHAAWLNFLQGVGPEDTIWFFSTTWTNEFKRKELREGYAAVRDDAINAHFLIFKRLDSD